MGKYTDIENNLMDLESPYAVMNKSIQTLRKYNINLEEIKKQIPDFKRFSCVVQLLASDLEYAKNENDKLFYTKDRITDPKTDIKSNGIVYSSYFISPEIPDDTILYYSRPKSYKDAPKSKLALYNSIATRAHIDTAKKFLRNVITSPDFDVLMLFDEETIDHLKFEHANTVRQQIQRVLSEQRPGTTICQIDYKSVDEFEKEKGYFNPEEYENYIKEKIDAAEDNILSNKNKQYIKDTLVANIDSILDWFRNEDNKLLESKDIDMKQMIIKYDIKNSPNYNGTAENPEYIGHGYDMLLNEKATQIIKLPLRIDKFAPLGINAKTFIPDILDERAVFTGKRFDLKEADIIGKEVILLNSKIKRINEKSEYCISRLEAFMGRTLTNKEKNFITEGISLTPDEEESIKNLVDATYQGIEYLDSPMYKAYAKLKALYTDKKIVAFFNCVRNINTIEITPETLDNRMASKFHRCIFSYNFKDNQFYLECLEAPRAAGQIVERKKVKYSALTDNEKKIFEQAYNIINEELKHYNKDREMFSNISDKKVLDKVFADDYKTKGEAKLLLDEIIRNATRQLEAEKEDVEEIQEGTQEEIQEEIR